MTAIQQTAVEWARENGIAFAFETQLDNHEPPRDYGRGQAWWYTHPNPIIGPGIVIENPGLFRDAHGCGYLVQTTDGVEAYYTAGWHSEHDYLILHPFPDSSEIVDWRMGPRRYYHLVVTG